MEMVRSTSFEKLLLYLLLLYSGTIDFPEFLQMMKKKSSEQDQLDVCLPCSEHGPLTYNLFSGSQGSV